MTLLKYVKDGNMSFFKFEYFSLITILFFTKTIFDSYSTIKKDDNRSTHAEI